MVPSVPQVKNDNASINTSRSTARMNRSSGAIMSNGSCQRILSSLTNNMEGGSKSLRKKTNSKQSIENTMKPSNIYGIILSIWVVFQLKKSYWVAPVNSMSYPVSSKVTPNTTSQCAHTHTNTQLDDHQSLTPSYAQELSSFLWHTVVTYWYLWTLPMVPMVSVSVTLTTK